MMERFADGGIWAWALGDYSNRRDLGSDPSQPGHTRGCGVVAVRMERRRSPLG